MGDKITAAARKEGYRARSVYKLQEIQRKFRVLKGDVLDIGCWPGSWLQYARSKAYGDVVGVDTKNIVPLEGVKFIQSDIFAEDLLDKIQEYGRFDVVLSDIAPETTGQIHLDQGRSAVMVEVVLEIALKVLKRHGSFVVKIFQSGESDAILQTMRKKFSLVKVFKPKASKKRSKEVYFIGKGRL